jgi:hypothetical protein
MELAAMIEINKTLLGLNANRGWLPIVLKSYAGSCGFKLPELLELEVAHRPAAMKDDEWAKWLQRTWDGPPWFVKCGQWPEYQLTPGNEGRVA